LPKSGKPGATFIRTLPLLQSLKVSLVSPAAGPYGYNNDVDDEIALTENKDELGV
jgi:hypothetical protein